VDLQPTVSICMSSSDASTDRVCLQVTRFIAAIRAQLNPPSRHRHAQIATDAGLGGHARDLVALKFAHRTPDLKASLQKLIRRASFGKTLSCERGLPRRRPALPLPIAPTARFTKCPRD